MKQAIAMTIFLVIIGWFWLFPRQEEIEYVNQAINEMSNNSTQVNTSAGGLATLSEELNNVVGQFKV